jgi:hypothetical protein
MELAHMQKEEMSPAVIQKKNSYEYKVVYAPPALMKRNIHFSGQELKHLTIAALLVIASSCCHLVWASSPDYTVGAFYYPKWRSDEVNWKDIQGDPGSRSPGRPWPDREPILGFYPEEELWVAEKHIGWASRYGIRFFAYEWQWNVDRPVHEHALKNYLRAGNRNKLQFCLLWDYPSARLEQQAEFDAMVSYWLQNYFDQPTYYRIDGKPVVFLFSPGQAELHVRKFGTTLADLLTRARSLAQERGLRGIYFVLATNEAPHAQLEKQLSSFGFDAYTGRNYAEQKGARIADYDQMVDAYLDCYHAAARTGKRMPYLPAASPGWYTRPWSGNRAIVRINPTPEKFERMLLEAKRLLREPSISQKVLMIEAWNEFGEGSYIEPTKKWGFKYLETIRKVFGP